MSESNSESAHRGMEPSHWIAAHRGVLGEISQRHGNDDALAVALAVTDSPLRDLDGLVSDAAHDFEPRRAATLITQRLLSRLGP